MFAAHQDMAPSVDRDPDGESQRVPLVRTISRTSKVSSAPNESRAIRSGAPALAVPSRLSSRYLCRSSASSGVFRLRAPMANLFLG